MNAADISWRGTSVILTVVVGSALCIIMTMPARQLSLRIEVHTHAEAVAAFVGALSVPAPVVPAQPALTTARPTPEAMSWSRADDEVQFFEAATPTFVHIPKNAGTSIYETIRDQGLNVRRNELGECQWHDPPHIHMRGAFAVIRPVLSRTVSEFCWAREQDTFKVYKQEFGATEVWPYTCDMFNDWLLAALLKYKQDPSFAWCHMVPQWCYASKVDHLLIQGPHLQNQLRSLHPEFAKAALGSAYAESTPGKDGPCKRFNITPACINASNMALLRDHFAEDFRYVEPLIERHGRNTKVGFQTPGRWVISEVRDDFECVQDMKTLTSDSPCNGTPDAPEAMRPTCVSTLLECARLASTDGQCSAIFSYYGTAAGGPGGQYPGWCKCLRRGKDEGDGNCADGRGTEGATTAYIGRDVAVGAPCPRIK